MTRCKLGVRENTTQIKRLSREQPHTRSTRFTRICKIRHRICNRIYLLQGVLVLVLCNRICLLWGHQWVFLCCHWFRLVFQTSLQSETRFVFHCSWMMRNQEGRGRRKTSKKINSCQNLVFFPTTANLNTRSAAHSGKHASDKLDNSKFNFSKEENSNNFMTTKISAHPHPCSWWAH